jgi:hypothetical protein
MISLARALSTVNGLQLRPRHVTDRTVREGNDQPVPAVVCH